MRPEKELNFSMKIGVKHIGLQVVEADVLNFYEGILGFKSTRSFSLNRNDSNDIFGIDSDVNIIFGNCGEVELELFVSSNPKQPDYNHVCLMVSNAEQLFKLAAQKGYRVFVRQGKLGLIYFITDSNHNIFEIKSL